jgi:hypothetical protein
MELPQSVYIYYFRNSIHQSNHPNINEDLPQSMLSQLLPDLQRLVDTLLSVLTLLLAGRLEFARDDIRMQKNYAPLQR